MNTGSELTADVRPKIAAGSLDGDGAGDTDTDYQCCWPNALAPFPFTPLQYARLLVLRGRLRDERRGALGH